MKELTKQTQRKLKQWTLCLGAGVLILFTLIFIGLYYFIDNAQLANQAIDSFYSLSLSKEEPLLNSTATSEQLNVFIDEVNQLKSPKYNTLKKHARALSQQYHDLALLNQLLIHPVTHFTEDNPLDDNALQPFVSVEDIELVNQQRLFSNDSIFNTTYEAILLNLTTSLNAVAQLSTLYDTLPNSIETEKDILLICPILNEMAPLIEQANYSQKDTTLLTNIDKTAQGYSRKLIELNEEEAFSEESIAILQQCPLLVPHIEDEIISPKRLVSLTFDDGPHPKITPQILDILQKHDVKATFFVMGAYVDQHPHLAKRIVEDGHIIANHTYSHPDLKTLSDEEVLHEIQLTQECIQNQTGITPHLFRMPFGSGGKRIVNLIKDEGLTSIIWNIDSADWMSQDEDKIYQLVTDNLKNRSLILMHDTHQATAHAIERLIPELKTKGYTFVDPLEVGYNYHYFQH